MQISKLKKSSSFLALFLLVGCQGNTVERPTTRVLFIGNSVTYTNNLPAMVAGLARANGDLLEARMIAKGGVTLKQHLANGVAAQAIRDGTDFVVLQERGGDLACYDFSPVVIQACTDSKSAHAALALLATQSGAKVVMLGTYQSNEAASLRLEEMEKELAGRAKIASEIHLSEQLRIVLQSRPSEAWLDADGVHPGDDLTMLMAIRVYQAIYGKLPRVLDVKVDGVDYPPTTIFSATTITKEPASDKVRRTITAGRMQALIQLAGSQVEDRH